MSDKNDSEEKTLQASRYKLKKQREKGNVVTSKDSVASITLTVCLIYLYFRRDWIAEKLIGLFLSDGPDASRGFAVQLEGKIEILWDLGFQVFVPIVCLSIVTSVLTGLIVAGGPNFATEPVIPKFQKISPASGLKRIFGRRALITFLMHLVRITVLLCAFVLVILFGWAAWSRAPFCGFYCGVETLDGAFLPLIVAGSIIMTASAIIDYLVQRSEFLREQRMSITEFRRELKDRDGDAKIKSQRMSIGRQMITAPKVGGREAVVLVSDGGDELYGVRYIEGETPAPLVVAKATTPTSAKRLRQLSAAPIVIDRQVAHAVAQKQLGAYVTEEETVVSLANLLSKLAQEGRLKDV